MHRKSDPKSVKKSGALTRRPDAAPSPRLLADMFAASGFTLSERQIEQFWTYHELLRRHNSVLNLTRIHNFANMVLKLYVDSALPARLIDLPSPLMDLGSGPGMPGIPLKIVRPDLHLQLVEGRAKRVAFLEEAVVALGFEHVEVIARKVMPGYDRMVAGVITRAVETIDQTLQRLQDCLPRGGKAIFMKGPGCDPEIETARGAFAGQYALVRNLDYRLARSEHERRLVVFERIVPPARELTARAAERHRAHGISSATNAQFKALKKLLTSHGIKKANQALLSGPRQVQDMIARFPERCLNWITPGDRPRPPEGCPPQTVWLQLADPLFEELDLFGTRSPLLCIQVPEVRAWKPEDGFGPGCTLLAPFQDPSNIGAAIRSAAAFGVTEVILLAESAHPYHPKALRASGGTVAFVELRQGPALGDLPEDLPIVALSSEGRDIRGVSFPDAFGLLAGMEGPGLPERWRRRALSIPIAPGVESLNAAAAVAVALYAWKSARPA